MTEAQIIEKEKTGYTKEDVMLADFMTWARNEFPQLRHKIFHIENEGSVGGRKGAMQGGVSLAKGKLAGVHDICLPFRSKVYWMEAKLIKEFRKKNRGLSDKQVIIHNLWREDGQFSIVFCTFGMFKFTLVNILNGTPENVTQAILDGMLPH